MSLVSMTGYADAQGAAGPNTRWRWEIRSVNGRGMELRLRLPPGFESLEPASRILANERFRRGNIQATLTLDSEYGVRGLKIDPAALASAVKIAQELAADTGLAPARIDGLLALKGVIVQEEMLAAAAPARAARDAAILESLSLAFDSLTRARRAEGAKLGTVLANLVSEIDGHIRQARDQAAAQPAALRDKLTAQVKELLGSATIAEERMAQEVAMLAVKADIREEIDRLMAHVHEARNLLSTDGAIGRKLDFLAQEFNREANTLCSKSSDIALTRTGLALKAAIDQFREQAQNVE